jgi:hypothetical protein
MASCLVCLQPVCARWSDRFGVSAGEGDAVDRGVDLAIAAAVEAAAVGAALSWPGSG